MITFFKNNDFILQFTACVNVIDASTIANIPNVEYGYSVNNGQMIHETSSNNGTFCLPPQLKESLISVVANKQGYNSGSVSGRLQKDVTWMIAMNPA